MDFYKSKGDTLYTASLDISKAFDISNHYKLFDRLIKAGISEWIIELFVDLYSKLTVKIGWSLSHSFIVRSGVRQGTFLFNVFIDLFIFELRKTNVGCHIFFMNLLLVYCIQTI